VSYDFWEKIMNKFLFSVILFACAAAKADVVLEMTFKEGDKDAVTQAVTLSRSVTQAACVLNEVPYKFVVTKMVKNEDGTCEFALNIFKVVDDQEVLVAQPEFSNLPATLTIADEADSFIFVATEVESNQEANVNA
jgi:hypothetical protein